MASAYELTLVCLFLVVFVNGNNQFSNVRKYPDPSSQARGSLWPAPKEMTASETQLVVDEEAFQFIYKSAEIVGSCGILEDAFVRYSRIIFGSNSNSLKFKPWRKLRTRSRYVAVVTQLQVTSPCVESAEYPSLSSDESCEYYRV